MVASLSLDGFAPLVHVQTESLSSDSFTSSMVQYDLIGAIVNLGQPMQSQPCECDFVNVWDTRYIPSQTSFKYLANVKLLVGPHFAGEKMKKICIYYPVCRTNLKIMLVPFTFGQIYLTIYPGFIYHSTFVATIILLTKCYSLERPKFIERSRDIMSTRTMLDVQPLF